MKNKKTEQKFYENYAAHWIEANERLIKDLESHYKINVLSSIIPKGLRFGRVLEFGCGNAAGLKLMSKFTKVNDLTGIDISKKMIELAKKNFPKAKLIRGDLKTLKKLNRKFDLILLLDILEHLPDPQEALRIARQKAKFLAIKVPLEKTFYNDVFGYNLSSDTGHLHFFTANDFEKLLEGEKIKTISKKVTFPPKEIALNDFFIAKFRQSKFGYLHMVLLRLLRLLPYSIISFFLGLKNGKDLFLFGCSKTNENSFC